MNSQVIERELLRKLEENDSENPLIETQIAMELLSRDMSLIEINKTISAKKPLQYVAGFTYVNNMKIKVTKDVLLPGPEIEFLLATARRYISENNVVLDLCTGSGVISTVLGSQMPTIKIIATDISRNALGIAKINSQKHKCTNIEFLQGDLFDSISEDYTSFNIIISNPPYCRTKNIEELLVQIKSYVPHIAINGGSDGLEFHRQIAENAHKYLKPKGYIILENEEGQSNDVQELLKKNNFVVVEVITNHLNQERIVVGMLNVE